MITKFNGRQKDEIRSDRLPTPKLMVEPGEAHTETYEFIVAEDLRPVVVYSMFVINPNSSTGDEDRNEGGMRRQYVI